MTRPQQIAALVTLVLAALIVLLLADLKVSWNPDEPWPPEPEPYIELAGEQFTVPEEIPLPDRVADAVDAPALTETDVDLPSDASQQTGAALRTESPEGKESPREVTQQKTAPAKAVKTPKPRDPGAEKAERERKDREATAKRTQNNVRNAFAKPNAAGNANNRKPGNEKTGSTKGNPQSAGPADSRSHSAGLRHGRVSGGWLWPSYPTNISTPLTGSVVLNLTIDRNGNVTEAVPAGGEAPAASDGKLQQQCIRIAKSRQFTRKPDSGDAPESARATLTFIFENKK